MQIIRATYAGACYGVERALSLALQAATGAHEDAEAIVPVYTLGPLIHNPQVVSDLRQSGVQAVGSIEEIDNGILVIRSHGVIPSVIEEARDKGLTVVDATCPHVSKAHQAARQLCEDGYTVVIVGEAGHPEVDGISAYAGADALVAKQPSDLPEVLSSERIGIVVQTTQSAETVDAIVAELNARGIQPLVKNTICFATTQRQQAAKRLAQDVDVMVVIGGRNSSNTTRLYEICQAFCPSTYHIESVAELDPVWFTGAEKVGVTAGASTPENQIAAVIAALEALS